jgi:hypothetical protein
MAALTTGSARDEALNSHEVGVKPAMADISSQVSQVIFSQQAFVHTFHLAARNGEVLSPGCELVSLSLSLPPSLPSDLVTRVGYLKDFGPDTSAPANRTDAIIYTLLRIKAG